MQNKNNGVDLLLHRSAAAIHSDLLQYIHRFRGITLDCHVKYEECEPAKFCIYNMPAENRAHRKNANIIKFVQLFQKAQNMALSI
jgi:hypothetical protein